VVVPPAPLPRVEVVVDGLLDPLTVVEEVGVEVVEVVVVDEVVVGCVEVGAVVVVVAGG